MTEVDFIGSRCGESELDSGRLRCARSHQRDIGHPLGHPAKQHLGRGGGRELTGHTPCLRRADAEHPSRGAERAQQFSHSSTPTIGGSFIGRNADGLIFSTLLSTGTVPLGGVQLFVKP